MTDDFDELVSEPPGGGNRLAELFRQVSDSLASLTDSAQRLRDVFEAIAPAAGGLPAAPRAVPGGAVPAGGLERLAADNLRANQQTARAIEDLLRDGIRLRDPPPAVYGE